METDRSADPFQWVNSWSAVYSGVQAPCQVPQRDFSVAGKREGERDGTSGETGAEGSRPGPALTRH